MQNLPSYPIFRKISLTDAGWYNEFYSRFDPYADFSFGNLYFWLDQYNDLMISNLNGNVILKATFSFMDKEAVVTILGEKELASSITQIFSEQKKQGDNPKLSAVPESIAESEQIKDTGIIAIPEPDNNEYLYNTDTWAQMEGSDLRKFRQKISIFNRDNGTDTEVKELDLSDSLTLPLLRESLAMWENVYSQNDVEQNEKLVLERLFRFMTVLPYGVIGLFIKSKLEGFVVYQALPHGYAVNFNHTKVSYRYKYMFDYILHKSAVLLQTKGITQINMEQDLGLQGLRNHKLSLRPKGFYKKFTLVPDL